MIITINTNATLITEEIASVLGKDRPRRVNVTLYGASNETYKKICHHPNGFDQCINGIKLLQKHNIDIKLNGSLVPENKDEVDALFSIASSLGLYIKIDTYMYPSSRKKIHPFKMESRLSAKEAAFKRMEIYQKQDENEYKEYCQYLCEHTRPVDENYPDGLTCRAGKSSYWISWDGQMSPCIFMDQPSIDVFKEGFNKSWDFVVEQAKQIKMPKKCIQCSKRTTCLVCGASVYCENKNYKDAPEYMCEFMDITLEIAKGETKI